jgi:hypothetical protein
MVFVIALSAAKAGVGVLEFHGVTPKRKAASAIYQAFAAVLYLKTIKACASSYEIESAGWHQNWRIPAREAGPAAPQRGSSPSREEGEGAGPAGATPQGRYEASA